MESETKSHLKAATHCFSKTPHSVFLVFQSRGKKKKKKTQKGHTDEQNAVGHCSAPLQSESYPFTSVLYYERLSYDSHNPFGKCTHASGLFRGFGSSASSRDPSSKTGCWSPSKRSLLTVDLSVKLWHGAGWGWLWDLFTPLLSPFASLNGASIWVLSPLNIMPTGVKLDLSLKAQGGTVG